MGTEHQPDGPLPSYRSRLTLVILLLGLSLIVVALLAHRHVTSLTASSAADAATRERNVLLVDDAFEQLHQLRLNLHAFLLKPHPAARQRLDAGLAGLSAALQRLNGAVTSLSRSNAQPATDADRLAELVQEIVAIRQDPARWFPAGQIIEQQLQVANNQMTTELDALLAETTGDDGAEATHPDLHCSLHILQKTWLRMVDEVRLLVANRLGAYSADPADGMAARRHNVGLYADRVERLLEQLARETRQSADQVLTAEVTGLARHAATWRVAYAQLIDTLSSTDWRRDLQFLDNTLEPQLWRVQQGLRALHQDFNVQATRQVDVLSRTSLRLGHILWLALGLMLVFALLGYFSLNRLILRPIGDLAHNLRRQSRDQAPSAPAPPTVRETRDLLNAFADMQAQVQQREEELDYLAHHDALTGLPNRSLFKRHLVEAIETAISNQMLVGLLFMDLDRFKQINDSYGHATGDQMLIEISRRLLKVFRQDDMVARFGGDEFAVLLQNLHDRTEMTRLAEKALSAIQRPYEFGGRMFYSGASIGIAVAPDDGDNPDRLIQLADAAMYAAKRDDGSSFRYVSEELTAAAAAQHALENELREAVDAHRLELHFQPVISTADGHVHSYESLLRWPHAQQGMLRPASFMNALADAGLCTRISDWALDQIQANRPTPESVLSINLSARLLHDDDFARRLFERIDTGRLQPDRLILEITEDTLETDLRAAARVLHELKRRGVRIALDDFGTGQASLSHLRRFPFDYIKIDQSFVSGIGEIANDEKLIQAIIRLAHALGMKVVAEGIETEAQREFLQREGCDYIQGYLLGRPSAKG